MNVAFWHMKHAAMIAAKDDLKIEEAKVNKFNLHFHMKLALGKISSCIDTSNKL